MGALDEYVRTLANLPPAVRQSAVAEARKATKHRRWVPNPGPQLAAYMSEADELLFGGEAGGGKSDLVVGLSLVEHQRSLILRRTNGEAVKIFDRYEEIIGNTLGKNEQKGWKIDGRIIDIGGCQLEQDKQKRKGIPHDLKCVGRGTKVLMSDWSYKPVEEVAAGDAVMTLEGARIVLRSFRSPNKHGVLVTAGRFTQAQSAEHMLLSRSGWACLDTPSFSSRAHQEEFLSTRSCFYDIGLPVVLRTLASAWRVLQNSYTWARNTAGLLSIVLDPAYWLGQSGWSAGMALPSPEICYAGSDGGRRVPSRQHQVGDASQEIASLGPLSGRPDSIGQLVLRGAADVAGMSGLADLKDGCASELHQRGGRIHEPQGRRTVSGGARQYPLLLADVGQQSPTSLQRDDAARTHRCSRRGQRYPHPYTKEIRSSEISLQEFSWAAVPLGEIELYDLEVEEVNHFITYGGFINKNCFDELVDFTKTQYEFIIAWNRSTDPNQRCRIVATTNPPTRPEGMWVVERWAPWLDPTHPKPAKDGELRWFTTIRGKDTEVDGPGPHDDGEGHMVMAKSRTFIRSRLSDNPDLTQNADYASRLAALPKELREAYMEGRFDVGLKDAPFQAIPTDWIREAQERWIEKPPKGIPMCGIGVDASGGGDDPMVLAIRHDGWYAPMIEIPGKEIPSARAGKFAAGLIISYRRNKAVVVVDMGGGYGGSVYEQLKENEIEVLSHKGSEGSVQRTLDGQIKFHNKRTQVIWRFREALDPSQPGGSPIFLPPDPMLLADLAAPTFWVQSGVLHVEPKEDVCERLQRSTDRGDAVVMAWSAGPTYLTDGDDWAHAMAAKVPLGRRPIVVMGRQNRRDN